MKRKIYQLDTKTETGDCLVSCLRTILEEDLHGFPTLPDDNTWIDLVNKNLNYRGYHLTPITTEAPEMCFRGLYIEIFNVPTKGCTHSVVCLNGEIWHDPTKGSDSSQYEKTNEYLMVTKIFHEESKFEYYLQSKYGAKGNDRYIPCDIIGEAKNGDLKIRVYGDRYGSNLRPVVRNAPENKVFHNTKLSDNQKVSRGITKGCLTED